MITAEKLLANGYRVYPAPKFSHADRLFQKAIRDKDGRRLFSLNFYEFDWRKFSQAPRNEIVYEADVYFQLPDEVAVQVKLYCLQDKSIEYAESLFEGMWEKLNLPYDEESK